MERPLTRQHSISGDGRQGAARRAPTIQRHGSCEHAAGDGAVKQVEAVVSLNGRSPGHDARMARFTSRARTQKMTKETTFFARRKFLLKLFGDAENLQARAGLRARARPCA